MTPNVSKGQSLYLDLLRFFLALVVFLGHASYRGYVGHPFPFWYLWAYGQTAVVGFFVLSGFVIAFVAADKEANPRTYAIARISRLYSVVIPALMLTAVLDAVGSRHNPTLYQIGPEHLSEQQPLRYLATFFFLQGSSLVAHDMSPGTNTPFWSLQMEGAYYLIFGLFLLRARAVASIAAICVLLVAGSGTALLFPCWLLGVVVFHLQKNIRVPLWLGGILFIAGGIGVALVGWLRQPIAFRMQHDLALKYAESVLFAVNIFGAAFVGKLLGVAFGWAETGVRWLGSLTFALYLTHVPLLLFLTSFGIGEPGSRTQMLWLFGVGGGAIIVMAWIGECLRHYLRERISLAFRSPPVAEASV